MVSVFSHKRRVKLQFFHPTIPLPILKKSLQTTSIRKPLNFIADSIEKFTEKNKLIHRASTLVIQIEMLSDLKMKSINQKHRKKNKTTDVLSFPLWDFINGSEISLPLMPETPLGDILVSLNVLLSQSNEFLLTPLEEFYHLVFHGFLHLMGFDHERSKKDEILMEKKERELIRTLKKIKNTNL
ncbi:MAG: rRNA maturation RNase YbeY [Bacteriovoracaceae bacterium]|nr:rRNA maturation RNase YbeY [Bacteriovoracaceae bacterium]